jgi:hypothetical protein
VHSSLSTIVESLSKNLNPFSSPVYVLITLHSMRPDEDAFNVAPLIKQAIQALGTEAAAKGKSHS